MNWSMRRVGGQGDRTGTEGAVGVGEARHQKGERGLSGPRGCIAKLSELHRDQKLGEEKPSLKAGEV